MDMGFSAGDVVSFEGDGNSITVRKERLCDDCKSAQNQCRDEKTLLELLDELSASEQRAALIHLSVKWAELQGKGDDDNARF
jgi:hypothetical protein